MARKEWKSFEKSIFSHITELANQYGAINLAQGFPDFDPPESVKAKAIEAIQSGHNQYAPSFGLMALREKLAERQYDNYALSYDPETEVTIFSGATEAIYCTLQGLCEPGDEVITFEPFFDCYPAASFAAGASFKTVRLHAPNWEFKAEELSEAITEKTKIIILNTPHNPTGRVFTRDEMKQIAELVIKHNLTVITDEVYEELLYPPARHFPFASLPGMRDRSVCISSFSKTYSVTGWKVGYAFAPPHLTKFIRIPHQYTVFCSATPLQFGALAALDLGSDYFHLLREKYEKRRSALYEALRELNFKCHQPAASYFIMADYSELSEFEDLEFAEKLIKEARVASIPVSGFYKDVAEFKSKHRYLRFGFCKSVEQIETAYQRLKDYFG